MYAVSAVRCANSWDARKLQPRAYVQFLCNFGADKCVEQLSRLRQVVVKSLFRGNRVHTGIPPKRLISRRHFSCWIHVVYTQCSVVAKSGIRRVCNAEEPSSTSCGKKRDIQISWEMGSHRYIPPKRLTSRRYFSCWIHVVYTQCSVVARSGSRRVRSAVVRPFTMSLKCRVFGYTWGLDFGSLKPVQRVK